MIYEEGVFKFNPRVTISPFSNTVSARVFGSLWTAKLLHDNLENERLAKWRCYFANLVPTGNLVADMRHPYAHRVLILDYERIDTHFPESKLPKIPFRQHFAVFKISPTPKSRIKSFALYTVPIDREKECLYCPNGGSVVIMGCDVVIMEGDVVKIGLHVVIIVLHVVIVKLWEFNGRLQATIPSGAWHFSAMSRPEVPAHPYFWIFELAFYNEPRESDLQSASALLPFVQTK